MIFWKWQYRFLRSQASAPPRNKLAPLLGSSAKHQFGGKRTVRTRPHHDRGGVIQPKIAARGGWPCGSGCLRTWRATAWALHAGVSRREQNHGIDSIDFVRLSRVADAPVAPTARVTKTPMAWVLIKIAEMVWRKPFTSTHNLFG